MGGMGGTERGHGCQACANAAHQGAAQTPQSPRPQGLAAPAHNQPKHKTCGTAGRGNGREWAGGGWRPAASGGTHKWQQQPPSRNKKTPLGDRKKTERSFPPCSIPLLPGQPLSPQRSQTMLATSSMTHNRHRRCAGGGVGCEHLRPNPEARARRSPTADSCKARQRRDWRRARRPPAPAPKRPQARASPSTWQTQGLQPLMQGGGSRGRLVRSGGRGAVPGATRCH